MVPISSLIEFIAAGSPRAVSRAIEAYADEQRLVRALVVPWESDRATVSMSITAATGEGWAIEHANLGTITLTDRGGDRTRVTIATEAAAAPRKGAPLLDRFAEDIRNRFQVAS